MAPASPLGLLIQERERHWDALRIGVLATLAVLAVRGLWLPAG